jgi:hypothetical protein
MSRKALLASLTQYSNKKLNPRFRLPLFNWQAAQQRCRMSPYPDPHFGNSC